MRPPVDVTDTLIAPIALGVTHLRVALFHAEQELLQFLQQKVETFVEARRLKPAHELLKMQLRRLCSGRVPHDLNEMGL